MNIKTPAFIAAFTAFVFLTGTLTTVASANELSSEPTAVVKFSELNLSSPAGVSTLYKRIHSAAMNVCSAGSTEDLSRRSQQMACADSAETKAIAKVNSASLNAYYQEKTGRSIATFAAN